MNKYCLALDLVNDPVLIAEYEDWHRKVWPGIIESIHVAGIEKMEIYRLENRLFMIMEVTELFSFEKKSASDALSPEVQKWEQLMWKYQQAIPGGKEGEKWRLMTKIFETVDQSFV
jgi:L-rhamnose mutarotase